MGDGEGDGGCGAEGARKLGAGDCVSGDMGNSPDGGKSFDP